MKAATLASLLVTSAAAGAAAAGGPFFFAVHTPISVAAQVTNQRFGNFPASPNPRVITEIDFPRPSNNDDKGQLTVRVNGAVVYQKWYGVDLNYSGGAYWEPSPTLRLTNGIPVPANATLQLEWTAGNLVGQVYFSISGYNY